MRNILETVWEATLDELARSDVLLAFDFDGTLAPIVDHPSQAVMRDSTRALLRVAAVLYPAAVISGRSRADLAPRLDRIPLVAMVGSHGAEPGFGPIDREMRRRVSGWLAAVRGPVESLAGVHVEDCGCSLSVHYRHARHRGDARRAITAAAQALPGARIVTGKAVVTVLPAEAPNKGEALGNLLARTGRARALYVGDDQTDEDAFRTARVVLGVRIGRTQRTAANAYLPNQGAIDALLRRLIGARRRAHGLSADTLSLERLLALP